MIGDLKINRKMSQGMVILIEPDDSVREALVLLLQSEGWHVKSLGGCEQLATAIADENITALVSESSLPGCTPLEILEQGKKFGFPVIFTGHSLPLQAAVDLIRLGAIDYLEKPFHQDRLMKLLTRIFEGGILADSKQL
jgi:two-component system response regulator FixJ